MLRSSFIICYTLDIDECERSICICVHQDIIVNHWILMEQCLHVKVTHTTLCLIAITTVILLQISMNVKSMIISVATIVLTLWVVITAAVDQDII